MMNGNSIMDLDMASSSVSISSHKTFNENRPIGRFLFKFSSCGGVRAAGGGLGFQINRNLVRPPRHFVPPLRRRGTLFFAFFLDNRAFAVIIGSLST